MLFTIMCLCVFVGWKCVKLLRWLKTCQRFFQIWIVSHRQQRTRTSLTELKAGAVFFSDELLLFYCNRQRCDASSSWIVGLSWKSQRILLMGLLIHSDKDFRCVMDGSHWENTSHHFKTWTFKKTLATKPRGSFVSMRNSVWAEDFITAQMCFLLSCGRVFLFSRGKKKEEGTTLTVKAPIKLWKQTSLFLKEKKIFYW